MLGGLSWFAVPWAFASCLGLSARALLNNVGFTWHMRSIFDVKCLSSLTFQRILPRCRQLRQVQGLLRRQQRLSSWEREVQLLFCSLFCE